MKFILGTLAVILVIGIAGFLLPSIIGVAIGIGLIKSGNIIGGLIAIVIGIGINIAMIYGGYAEGNTGGGHSYIDDECPFCGSGDTDGNHCYTCNEDY